MNELCAFPIKHNSFLVTMLFFVSIFMCLWAAARYFQDRKCQYRSEKGWYNVIQKVKISHVSKCKNYGAPKRFLILSLKIILSWKK